MPRIPVYDATLYTGKPDSGERTTYNAVDRVVAPQLRSLSYTDRDHLVEGEYSQSATQEWAATLDEDDGPCIVDTESWQLLNKGLYSRKVIVSSLEKMNTLMQDIRAVNRRLRLGHYSAIQRDWVQVTGPAPSRTAAWVAANAYLRRRVAWYTPPFTKFVDYVCPDAYLVIPEGTVAQQKTWITDWLALSAPEWEKFHKPILPFIWAEYHGGSGRDWGTPVDLEVWDHLLAEITEVSDGLILWGGADFDAAGVFQGLLPWDGNFNNHYTILKRYALPRGETA